MKKTILLFCCSLFMVQLSYSQNVGIGITNPTRAKLEIHGAVGANSAIFGGESSGISLQRNWPAVGFNQYYNGGNRHMSNGYAAVQYLDPGAGYMAIDLFNYNSTNSPSGNPKRAVTISQSGNFAIGAPIADASLSVAKSFYTATAYLFGSTHHSAFNFGNDEHTYIRAGKNNSTVFINDIPGSKISLTGSVGINTSLPVYPLEIRQPAADKGLAIVNSNNFHNWELRVTGDVGYLFLLHDGIERGAFYTNGSYTYISDKRIKTNVRGLPSLLDKLMQLKPVSYEMIHKNPTHQKSIGFIAQDVKNLFPELVSVLSNTKTGYEGITDLHTLDYSGFGILAVKAIQEQQQLIQSQQLQIDELKKIVNEFVGKHVQK